MPSTERTTLPIAQLTLSRFNCRTNQEDASAVDAIAASILQRGLIHPLQVHLLLGSKTKYGVFAGGRRYRAHRKLIEAGDLPADHAIAVIVHDVSEVELIELSLAENLLRRDLRPYEEVAAVRRARNAGHDARQIADALGQTVVWVERALRLAELAPPIFQALSDGGITLEQAKAFGATGDRLLQAAAWDRLRGGGQSLPVGLKLDFIRQALGLDDAELDRQLRYVGDDAYRAAGGSWELDLFAGDEGARGKLQQPELLQRMAGDKLGTVRSDLRRRAKRDVAFRPKPPADPTYPAADDHQLRYQPPEGSITDVAGQGSITLPDGVIGVLKLANTGQPEVSWWWESRKAKHSAARPAKPRLSTAQAKSGAALAGPSSDAARAADSKVKEEFGGTRDTVQILRSMRRAVLRAGLLDAARGGSAAGSDFLAWAQCRLMLSDDYTLPGRMGVGSLRGMTADPPEAAGYLRQIGAQNVIDRAVRELTSREWASDPDLAASFRAFRREPPELRALAAAWVAGLMLERSVNADGYQVPVHDELALHVGLASSSGVRAYWSPSTELLRDLGKGPMLEIAEPFVEAATFGTWRSLTVEQLASQVVRVVTGKAEALRRSLVAAAAQWVHPLMLFNPPAPDADLAAAPAERELVEAAQ